MKPETLQKIREMAEEKFPINKEMPAIDAALSHGYRKIFVQAAEAAISTPELLEGEGWRKDGWTKEKPKNDSEKMFIARRWYDKQWNYEAWHIRKVYDGDSFYFGLVDQNGYEFPYEELSASMYFEIPLLSLPPSE